jgi:hypothetical protein
MNRFADREKERTEEGIGILSASMNVTATLTGNVVALMPPSRCTGSPLRLRPQILENRARLASGRNSFQIFRSARGGFWPISEAEGAGRGGCFLGCTCRGAVGHYGRQKALVPLRANQ